MDFRGGDRSHATVLQLLTKELRVVCLTVFVQHITAPPRVWGGAALFTLRPQSRLYRLAAEKKWILWRPPHLPLLMRKPLSSSPRTRSRTDTFGSISGMDDDDNTDDDVNLEVTSKRFAHQTATGRSEITLQPTRLKALNQIQWHVLYCSHPTGRIIIAFVTVHPAQTCLLYFTSVFYSFILFYHKIWLTQNCDSVSTPWIFKWLTVIGALPHMPPFSQLPWLHFKQQQLLQRLYLEMKKAEKKPTIQKR